MNLSYEQFLYEKSLLESYGHNSIITYKEWLEIKKMA